MSLTVGRILSRAQTVIQDTLGTFWPREELLDWFNDARRAILTHKPSAGAQNVVLPLVQGSYQPLAPDVVALLRIYRNVEAVGTGEVPPADRRPGRVVRIVERHAMDSQLPNWHEAAATTQVDHYMVDSDDPHTFYVYPPNDGTGKVEALVAFAMEELALTDEDDPLDMDTGFPDVYGNAILDFVLYRAYLKNANFAGSLERATAHYNMFAQALGIRHQAMLVSNAKTEAAVVKEDGGI